MLPLPIDPLLPQIVRALEDPGALVIEAPPGAGKTTRVPRALLDAGLAEVGEILVLQPRRLPARLAAARVADELGEPPGKTVGFSVRFENVSSPHTRIRFITEGVLLRRLLSDPRLEGVAVVVLDEFHERHLATDLALALLKALRAGPRPELRLCVMSATLEADPVREYLGACAMLRSEGRAHDVAIDYLREPDARPLAEQVVGAVRRLRQEGSHGDVLVFLPGAAEIRRAAEALAPLASQRDLLVLPLHGDLSPAEQDRAVRRADRPKVILATNVAETSVTIDGVVAVVDSGLARVAGHCPWSGLSTLTVQKISQASAIQRAGRAGRTQPGRALRLYTQHDLESRRGFDLPEIARLDLAEPVLLLHALGVRVTEAFPWFEPPPGPALGASEELLRRLGALDCSGGLSSIGERMLRFAVHPRLARLIVEGEKHGVGALAATLAAIVAEGDIDDRARARFDGGGSSLPGRVADNTDLLERLDRFEQARSTQFARDRLRALSLHGRAVDAVERTRRQLAAQVRDEAPPPRSPDAVDEILAHATLAAFPDRVMRRRTPGGGEAVLAGGGTAQVGPLPDAELLVAVDVEERGAGPGRRGPASTVVRLAVGIRPEALLEMGMDLVSTDELIWNAQSERVERLGRLAHGQIVLEESRRPAEPSAQASRLLLQAALAAGLGGATRDDDRASAPSLATRLSLLREHFPEAGVPMADMTEQRRTLEAACEGRTSLAELRQADLHSLWLAQLPATVATLMRQQTPERVRLPSGREVPVHYEADKPPWIESRLQDFFGLSVGPTICRGKVPLTLHLLAPNLRAVQVTRDLAGFWRQHYPGLRRELGRRYPRHAWPEDGATAKPPPPKPPRVR